MIVLPRAGVTLATGDGTTWRVLRDAWRERADLYHLHDPELLPVGLS